MLCLQDTEVGMSVSEATERERPQEEISILVEMLIGVGIWGLGEVINGEKKRRQKW